MNKQFGDPPRFEWLLCHTLFEEEPYPCGLSEDELDSENDVSPKSLFEYFGVDECPIMLYCFEVGHPCCLYWVNRTWLAGGLYWSGWNCPPCKNDELLDENDEFAE